MYKVKRFSACGYSRVIYVNQRQFGLIGNLRNKLAEKLTKSIKVDSERLVEADKFLKSPKLIDDFRIAAPLQREAKRYKSRVMDIPFNKNESVNKLIRSKDLKDKLPEIKVQTDKANRPDIYRKISSAVSENDSIINHPLGSGNEFLAHEVGHLMNSKGNFKDRIIHHLDSRDIFNDSKSSGLIGTAKSFLRSKTKLAEESNATRNAMKLLRSTKATPDQLKMAESNLNSALDTYKSYDIKWKSSLRNFLKTKE